MANNNNISKYSALDIEKYHKGELSAAEMHAMEKAALDDPFLADALEGYEFAGPALQSDLADLQSRLKKQSTTGAPVIPMNFPEYKPEKRGNTWMRVAVMIAVIAGAALLANQFLFNSKPGDIASNNNKPGTEETVTPIISDTSGPASPPVPATTTGTASNKPAESSTSPKAVKQVRDNTVADDRAPVASPVNPVRELNETAAIPEKKIVENDQVVSRSVTQDNKQTADKERKQDARKRMASEEAVAKNSEAANQREVANPGAVNSYRNTARTFRGRVTDNSRAGVPFANVTNIADNVGTYTDASGYFNLTSPDSILQVQVRSIGFENAVIELRNDLPANEVVLKEDNKELTAVVLQKQKPNSASRAGNTRIELEESEPADGWDNYDSYLANNLVPPKELITRQKSSGTVELSFELDRNGEPVKFRIEKSLCSSCDKEAIRLVKEGPKWKKNAGKGRTRVTINF